jgi:hypothetical protein
MGKRWFASGGGIARMGPFRSHKAAMKEMKYCEDATVPVVTRTVLGIRQISIVEVAIIEHQRIGKDYPDDLKIWSE